MRPISKFDHDTIPHGRQRASRNNDMADVAYAAVMIGGFLGMLYLLLKHS